MLLSRKAVLWGVITLAIAIFIGILYWNMSGRIAYAARACDHASSQQDVQIDCWSQLLRVEVKDHGIERAMSAFAYIYDTYPVFAQTGCHTHAHRLGDVAYYEFYLANPSFDAMEFPQATASCGYGFYHGFFEHLIQNNPRTSFITETCDYFQDRLGATMRDIRPICYHGSGHGLMLAQAAKVSSKDWGNARAFTHVPLAECETLTEATKRETEECQEGIFNVLVDWMETEEYGFAYDDDHPFAVCDVETKYAWKRACYYEMSQKLDRLAHGNMKSLAGVVSDIRDSSLREMAFDVGVAGIMQNISDSEQYHGIIRECVALPEELADNCVSSAIAGLFEHGSPQKEFEPAIDACSKDVTEGTPAAGACWRAAAQRLARFYTPQRTAEICKMIPAEFRAECSAK